MFDQQNGHPARAGEQVESLHNGRLSSVRKQLLTIGLRGEAIMTWAGDGMGQILRLTSAEWDLTLIVGESVVR